MKLSKNDLVCVDHEVGKSVKSDVLEVWEVLEESSNHLEVGDLVAGNLQLLNNGRKLGTGLWLQLLKCCCKGTDWILKRKCRGPCVASQKQDLSYENRTMLCGLHCCQACCCCKLQDARGSGS